MKTTRALEARRTRRTPTRWITAVGLLFLAVPGTRAETYSRNVDLGAVSEPTRVTGYRGTPFRLEGDPTDLGLVAVSSEERRDHPCRVNVGLESANDSARVITERRNLCGKGDLSKAIEANYPDTGINARRIFVTGLRVCTNHKETRVKGLQARGMRITDDGLLVSLDPPGEPTWVAARLSGGHSTRWQEDPEKPTDFRTNCKEWLDWTDCPAGQIATGVVAHFEAGKEPRSLTGLQLLCRPVTPGSPGEPLPKTGDVAVDKTGDTQVQKTANR